MEKLLLHALLPSGGLLIHKHCYSISTYIICLSNVDSLHKSTATPGFLVFLTWTPHIKKLCFFISPCFPVADPSYINTATPNCTAFLRWTPYTKALVLSYPCSQWGGLLTPKHCYSHVPFFPAVGSFTKALLLPYALHSKGTEALLFPDSLLS